MRPLTATASVLVLGVLLPCVLVGQAAAPDVRPLTGCLEEFSRYIQPHRPYLLRLDRTPGGATVTFSSGEFRMEPSKYTLAGTCVWREADGGTVQITMTKAAVDAPGDQPHLGAVLKGAFEDQHLRLLSEDAWTFRYWPSRYWPAGDRARYLPDVHVVSIEGLPRFIGCDMRVYVGEDGVVLGIELGM